MSAVAENDMYTVFRSLEEKMPTNEASSSGLTALHIACIYGYTWAVIKLLKHSADWKAVDSSGRSPLMIACQRGKVDIVKLLLEAGASHPTHLNAVDVFHNTALCYASARGSQPLAKLLLAYGASVCNEDASCSRTPATIAREEGFSDLADLLQRTLDVHKEAQVSDSCHSRSWKLPVYLKSLLPSSGYPEADRSLQEHLQEQ